MGGVDLQVVHFEHLLARVKLWGFSEALTGQMYIMHLSHVDIRENSTQKSKTYL